MVFIPIGNGVSFVIFSSLFSSFVYKGKRICGEHDMLLGIQEEVAGIIFLDFKEGIFPLFLFRPVQYPESSLRDWQTPRNNG